MKKPSKFTVLRLVLGGAIVGASVAGIVAPTGNDVAGALVGGTLSALLIKIAHVVQHVEHFQFDGNIIDAVTLGVGLVAILVKPIIRLIKGRRPCFIFRDCIVDFLNGSAIVPFLVLMGAVFSKGLLDEALKTNKLSLAIAGVIGFAFVLREVINEAPERPGPNSVQPPK